ncbi:hypothetical protein B0H13DRAFT_2322563 [Mycena leptocephala]|nr:hypothetical protein B0H13DRAFT_2322563 [Mycena leptocephala]
MHAFCCSHGTHVSRVLIHIEDPLARDAVFLDSTATIIRVSSHRTLCSSFSPSRPLSSRRIIRLRSYSVMVAVLIASSHGANSCPTPVSPSPTFPPTPPIGRLPSIGLPILDISATPTCRPLFARVSINSGPPASSSPRQPSCPVRPCPPPTSRPLYLANSSKHSSHPPHLSLAPPSGSRLPALPSANSVLSPLGAVLSDHLWLCPTKRYAHQSSRPVPTTGITVKILTRSPRPTTKLARIAAPFSSA